MVRKGRTMLPEKPGKIIRMVEDEFRDIQDISEASLSQLWLRKAEDVWNRYLKESKK